MSNHYFQFKQFTVWHDRCAMKIGTDGVLLGAWTPAEGARRVLDVGTGSGLIALQMAQRLPEAQIVAIELDPSAAGQATENFAASPWSERMEVVCGDFAHFTASPFDLILSNPPYFSHALRNPDASRCMARHNDTLPYTTLFRQSAALLAPHGQVCVIVPTEVEHEVMDAAWFSNLRLIHATRLYTKAGKPCKRLLLAFTPRSEGEYGLQPFTDELYIHDPDGSYSAGYRQLTEPFYLNLNR